jgi:hypothetical protein
MGPPKDCQQVVVLVRYSVNERPMLLIINSPFHVCLTIGACPTDYYCPTQSTSPTACSANAGTSTTGSDAVTDCQCVAGFGGPNGGLCSGAYLHSIFNLRYP